MLTNSWMTGGIAGQPMPWLVTNSLDQIVARFVSKAEATAMVAFHGGIVTEACDYLDCPDAAHCVADIADGLGFRPMCFDHAFDRGRRVESPESGLVRVSA